MVNHWSMSSSRVQVLLHCSRVCLYILFLYLLVGIVAQVFCLVKCHSSLFVKILGNSPNEFFVNDRKKG